LCSATATGITATACVIFKTNGWLHTPEHLSAGFTKWIFRGWDCRFPKKEIESRFELIESKVPVQLSENLWFLGEIPRQNDFEAQSTSFVDDFQNDDFIPDDSALAALVNKRLVVITGCSHSGICNIVEFAKKVTGISDVKAVFGGFHLKDQNEQTRKTIEYFKSNTGLNRFTPSHCTELPALTAFYEAFQNRQIKTGMVLEF
jgi:7,8-dihydropterin-6-yl-methyl-4-(beta-D-ribofuranosyl)aminobenzene 5'-phosphate synthase